MGPIPVGNRDRCFIRSDRGIRKPPRPAWAKNRHGGLLFLGTDLGPQYLAQRVRRFTRSVGGDYHPNRFRGQCHWRCLELGGSFPANLQIQAAPDGKDDFQQFIDGDVDAIFHPAEPQVFVDRNPIVDRLFPDHRTAERAHLKKTGIFPIMHMVAIRRDVAAASRWLSQAVFDADCQAKQADYQLMHKLGSYYSPLPWFGQELRETRDLMGENFYPDGVSQTRKALGIACQFLFEQGLAKRKLSMDELINAESLELEERMAYFPVTICSGIRERDSMVRSTRGAGRPLTALTCQPLFPATHRIRYGTLQCPLCWICKNSGPLFLGMPESCESDYGFQDCDW